MLDGAMHLNLIGIVPLISSVDRQCLVSVCTTDWVKDRKGARLANRLNPYEEVMAISPIQSPLLHPIVECQ